MTQLRRLSSWLAVAALFLASPRSAQPSFAQSPAVPERFERWLTAIKAHVPRDPGLVAVEISGWSGPELDTVIADAKRHARVLAKTDPVRANEILLRGAALHADIAKLIPEDTVRRSARQRTTYIVRDGRWVGVRYISIHWQLGRSLLDSVTPDPASHPGVHAWYLETSDDLAELRQFAAAVDHLTRARQLFPSDPAILFASGVMHERFSSAEMQAAAESVSESNREAAAINTARGELTRAERFFRDTLALRPDHVHARIRYGRVLDEAGRHDDAASELRRAIEDGASEELLYLAQLFLGRAEDARGNVQAARAAFERASALYPDAQSPRLALSQIARGVGDRAAAQRQLHAIAKLPDDERRRKDPWWVYYDIR